MALGAKTGGRRKGSINRATRDARAAIGRFVDGNAHKLQQWLDSIAEEKGPQAAFDCFTDLIEYHVPKLARHELTGEGGGAVIVKSTPLDDEQ